MIDIELIETFVENNSDNILTDIDENENGEEVLKLFVQWCNTGYSDDNAHRDFVISELCSLIEKIKKEFDVTVTDDEDSALDDEKEAVIVTLN